MVRSSQSAQQEQEHLEEKEKKVNQFHNELRCGSRLNNARADGKRREDKKSSLQ